MDDLELIKQKINIVDLLSEYLPLKKAGVNYKANCPFHNEKTASFMVSPERGIWHCFGCFPPGELVKTPFGYHDIENIDQSHWVISGKGRIRKVTDVMVHQYNGELITIWLRKLGGSVRLTADHNVFVVRGPEYTRDYKNFSKRFKKYLNIRTTDPTKYQHLMEKYFPIEKIPSAQLKVGDKLLFPIDRTITDLRTLDLTKYLTKPAKFGPLPHQIPLQIPVNANFLRLLGYWIAEGSNHRAYIRFSLGNHEEDLAQEIIDLVKKLFGLEGKIHRRSSHKKTGLEITVCHSLLANIFENLCGKGAENKHIPFVFQQLPVKKQKVLLEAIQRGDGTSFVSNKSKHTTNSIATISKVLAEQLVDILLRMNIFPTKTAREGSVDKKSVNHKRVYRIFWLGNSLERYNLSYHGEDNTEYWLLPIKEIKRENYIGPVHNFTVDQDHSYVATNFAVGNCDKGGDIFKFLMEKEGLSFPDALEVLAQKAGITLKKGEKSKSKDEKDHLFEANLKAQQFFHYMLVEHPLGKKALDYLINRGLTLETIKEFGIGYAPQSWESLTKFLEKRGFTKADLIKAGLAVPSKKGCYDRFRGRVTFPLIDIRGRVMGFSGRVLDKSEPKYINTPQTPIFDKGRTLFGLHLSKGFIRDTKSAILTEGEMDTIMSYQSGVRNVVASKGTALTENQIDLIKKYTDTIDLCFDMDLAGDSAARRGIEIADAAGLNIRVVRLPEGKDPGELCLKDPKAWEKSVKEAQPIYDYYLESVKKRYNLKEASDKKAAFIEILPIWKKIHDPLVLDHYVQKLSAMFQIKDDLIYRELEKFSSSFAYKQLDKLTSSGSWKEQSISPQPSKPEGRDDKIKLHDRRKLLEEYLVSLLLHIPASYTYIPNFPETLFTQEDLRQIYVLLVLFLDSISFKAKAFKISEFAKSIPSELLERVDRLYLMQLDEKLLESRLWQKEVDSVVTELKKMLIKSSLEKLSLEIKNAQEFDNIETLENLNKKFRDLSIKLKNL